MPSRTLRGSGGPARYRQTRVWGPAGGATRQDTPAPARLQAWVAQQLPLFVSILIQVTLLPVLCTAFSTLKLSQGALGLAAVCKQASGVRVGQADGYARRHSSLHLCSRCNHTCQSPHLLRFWSCQNAYLPVFLQRPAEPSSCCARWPSPYLSWTDYGEVWPLHPMGHP